MPLTFSFRVDEQAFYDDLQSFARFFLADVSGKEPSDIPVKEVYKDKYGTNHQVYYKFGFNIPAKRPIGPLKNRFLNVKPEDAPKLPLFFSGKNMWMLKPSWMSRGRGLELFRTLEELNILLKGYLSGYQARDYSKMRYTEKNENSPIVDISKVKLSKQKSVEMGQGYGQAAKSSINQMTHFKATTFPIFVIQKYMEKPMLFKDYKFDIRVYACLNHEMEMFVFREGYVRLSSYKYTLDKMNYYIHLTNNAVQAACPHFGQFLKGNILTITELEDYARKFKPDLPKGDFMRQIRDIIRLTFDATHHILNTNNRKYCFELYGFDFMIDKNYKVWMLEVNSGPSLAESNEMVSSLLARMLDDLFKVTVDKLFPPPKETQLDPDLLKAYPFLNYPDKEVLFDLQHKYSL